MYSGILAVVLLYLLFSITNILTIVSFIESVDARRLANEALFLGVAIAVGAQIFLIYCISLLLQYGSIIYVASGILLLYWGTKGLFKHEKKLYKRILFPHRHIWHIIGKIALIDLTLSLDNVVAVVSVTHNVDYIVAGLLVTIFFLFLLITFVRDYFHHIKGMEITSAFLMLFLGFKFITAPFGLFLSNILTLIVIIAVCTSILAYYNHRNVSYIWQIFVRNVRKRRKYIN